MENVMDETLVKKEQRVQNSAVINPYALAELISGRKINWKKLPNARIVLEEILQTPYEKLFDPKHNSPLYLGLKLNDKLQLERTIPEFNDPARTTAVNDLEQYQDFELKQIEYLRDLQSIFKTEDVAGIKVDHSEMGDGDTIHLKLRKPVRVNPLSFISKEIVEMVTFVPELRDSKKDFNPPNSYWGDFGRFFNETAEFFDPIQGAVANCYFIAALASVAWARPYMIRHLTRATGMNDTAFTNMIRFFDIDNGNAPREIEVTDTIPLSSSSNTPMYCRSSEAGEIWPAVYEKAFAKWKTGIQGDHPDITATAWGDCVRAAAELTGLNRHYFNTLNYTGDQLWNLVRQNSLSKKTFNPMVAATYSTGEASEKKIVYGDANLVASHCYSVLGWAYRDNNKYIILRNPWGSTEANIFNLTGTEYFFDVSWWRPIALTEPDGVFALHIEVFKQYFSTLGLVK